MAWNGVGKAGKEGGWRAETLMRLGLGWRVLVDGEMCSGRCDGIHVVVCLLGLV